MCGIAGFTGAADDVMLKRMTHVMSHRGPDDEGYYSDEDVHLGHKRLSIIDLQGGRQPLFNEDRSVVVVCNGEIYNHSQLRSDLERKGHAFRTDSDNEIINHLYEEYGQHFVEHLNGMFAFGLWDQKNKILMLARDRLGIKPLYYAQNDELIFASEMRAVKYALERKRIVKLSSCGVRQYLGLRYTVNPDTLIEGIKKIEPGTYLIWQKGTCNSRRYWDIGSHIPVKTEESALDELDRLCRAAVHRRLMAEVPLGILLSAGMDSNLVLHYAAERQRPMKTFTMGFGTRDDETDLTRKIAKEYKTDHHEYCFHRGDFSHFESAAAAMDSPCGDLNTIAWHIFCRFVRDHVTVALSGQGADELMAGYVHHTFYYRLTKLCRLLRSSYVYPVMAKTLAAIPPGLLNALFRHPARFGREERRKLINFFAEHKRDADSYLSLISVFDVQELKELCTEDFYHRIIGNGKGHDRNVIKELDADHRDAVIGKVLSFEKKYWLPDFTLEFTDNVSMAHSLEIRVPFLDHTVVEFLEQQPIGQKIRWSRNKISLTRLAQRHLGTRAGVRKKLGFYVPADQWSEEDIRFLVDKHLSREIVRRQGLFRHEYVEGLFRKFTFSPLIVAKKIFNLAIFAVWYQHNFETRNDQDAQRDHHQRTLLRA